MKRDPRFRGALFALTSVLRQGTVDGAECVADLGSQNPHHSDHDDGDERKDNRVLDEPLAFFLGCKQHNNLPFKKIDELPEDLPQLQRHDCLFHRRLHPKTRLATVSLRIPNFAIELI